MAGLEWSDFPPNSKYEYVYFPNMQVINKKVLCFKVMCFKVLKYNM